MKKRIAIIGLGIMGHGIADNYMKNGYEVVVWNRSADKVAKLGGAKLAGSPKKAAEQADIILEVTANDESSRSVWLGKDGILAGAKEGQFLIACPTLSVDWVEELAKECASRNLIFFDMPMTGGRMGAESGQLILLAGGDKEQIEKVEPDLKAIAKDVKYFGPVSSGTKYKLILNTLQGIIVLGFGEVMKMAKEAGLDEDLVGESLTELPGGYTVNVAWNSHKDGHKKVNFSAEWEDKDLNYGKKMTPKGNYPLRDKAIDKFDEVVEQGHGKDDWTIVNKQDN